MLDQSEAPARDQYCPFVPIYLKALLLNSASPVFTYYNQFG